MEGLNGIPPNQEIIFQKYWRSRALEWKEEIDNSFMDQNSKDRLKTFIDLNFLRAYINNTDRPSVNIFIDAIMEEMDASETEESEIYEKNDERRIYQKILDEVRELLINPKNN